MSLPARRLKIVLLQDYLRMGGTERQTLSLSRAFILAGHEVGLVLFRPGGPLLPDVHPAVQLLPLQPFDSGLDWFAPRLIAALRRWSPDIIMPMGLMANCHAARFPSALPSSSVVATVSTGDAQPWLHRRALRGAAAVVTNSARTTDRVCRDYRLDPRKVHTIHNAVATPPACPPGARERLRRELSASDHTVVLLCTAMFRPLKGHRRLIEAAARLPADLPWALWLAGEGCVRPAAERLARQLGVEDRVRFLGLRRDTTELCAAADVAVLASESESLPNFLVEAQWHGLPVVACDVAGVQETFIPGASGLLVEPGDTPALAAALRRIATDADLRGSLAAAAGTHARSCFDPDQQNARYLALFQNLRL